MKFEITDQQVLRTAYFTVEGEDGTVYNVNLQENEWFDSWQVMDEDGEGGNRNDHNQTRN